MTFQMGGERRLRRKGAHCCCFGVQVNRQRDPPALLIPPAESRRMTADLIIFTEVNQK